MSDKLLKYTVIFLAILIFFCFLLLLYGFYSKISNSQSQSSAEISNYSLKLDNKARIVDVKIINENEILAVISEDDQLIFIIYNLKKNEIVSRIGR
ncbi:MAG: hypothetical protein HOF20_01135 [Pelagibacteraceae bacterium]|jgi:hypothetical protein|nr:hypothetical protein [Pelagibacteraceae bacterium]